MHETLNGTRVRYAHTNCMRVNGTTVRAREEIKCGGRAPEALTLPWCTARPLGRVVRLLLEAANLLDDVERVVVLRRRSSRCAPIFADYGGTEGSLLVFSR